MGGLDADAPTPPTEVAVALPFDDSAPRLARQFIAAATGSLPGEVRADGLLLASELVTNAVRYGEPEIGLRVGILGDRLRVEVSDLGADRPALGSLSGGSGGSGTPTGQPRGRGLVIVDHLATAWGVDDGERGGKTVWFELQLPD